MTFLLSLPDEPEAVRDRPKHQSAVTPWIGSRSRWVPGCGSCHHFDHCRGEKGVAADTNACQYQENRYVRRLKT